MEKTIRGLSTGFASIMKCILALAVNTPYVFLDEPVLGLDANHREMFYRLLLEKYSESPFCCVISTHLIEEVSGMIEDVIMIRRGEAICSENREQLLSEVCMLSGPAEAVDRSLAGVTVLGEEVLGGLKTVCVQGCPEEMAPGVDVSAVDLQKLFVMMTND